MTREEAIRILDPETMVETLAEIEYYGGFRGRTKAAQALSDACILAVAALREQEERSKPKEAQQMDVREKLVEMIESARYWGSGTSEEIASHLIDNGVTVQEWISVDDRLPEPGERVLATDG